MKFKWPHYPKSESDFESLMQAIDTVLSERNLDPWKRPMHIGRLFWEAFRWGGRLFPPIELANAPGFEGEVLMAKAQKWYEDTYGEKLHSEWAFGHAPVKLGNALWRVRAGLIFGHVTFFYDRNLNNKGVKLAKAGDNQDASCNVLCEVDGITQGLADRLNDNDLIKFYSFYCYMFRCMHWRSLLPKTDLFKISGADYDESTSSLLNNRFEQSRWGSQQSAEKLIKGFLEIGGTTFPKGKDGHNLIKLSELLKTNHDIKISKELLKLASCTTHMRYGAEKWTEAQALVANHAVLGIIDVLLKSIKATELLKNTAIEK